MGFVDFWGRTHRKFREKAFVTKSVDGTIEKAQESGQLEKTLGPLDLVMLGVGAIIGAGVFVLTGEAAAEFAGPAVILSYLISSSVAIVSALSYAEFAVDMPVAGGAFNYINLVFGEFIAWQAGMGLVLEYTLGAAAVSKGFSGYLASLFGQGTDALVVDRGFFRLDFLAFFLVIGLSFLLSYGTKESSTFNIVVTSINLASIFFVLAVAFPKANSDNLTPFMPKGVRGMFKAAGVVFFSYIGFDTLATAAEEVKNPSFDLPVGIVGSLGICSVLYALMALAISALESYTQIDPHAPFSEAFAHIGLRWAGEIVSVGAMTGIVTSLLVNLIGQSRVYVTLGRQHLLPPWIAELHEKRSTPVHAVIVTACAAGFLALFLDIDLLARLVSMGTLFVLGLVSLGVIVRRYYNRGGDQPQWPLAVRVAILVFACLMEGVAFANGWHISAILVCIGTAVAATVSLTFLPIVFSPAKFSVPLKPYIPALGVFATIHLIFSLGWEAYLLFFTWQLLGIIVYLTYGVHHTPEDGAKLATQKSTLTAGEVELGEKDTVKLFENGVEASDNAQLGEVQLRGEWDSYMHTRS